MAVPLTNATEFTVSELAQAVKRAVEDEFGHVRVRGEISGFRGQHSSGHAYFTLKDADSSLDAVVWKGNWARLTFKPEEGLEVIASGRLTTFPRSSKYQIVIEQLEPAGAGALMALLETRRKALLAEGLFDAARKRALPYLPRVIGVITSPTGAVIRDILHRLADRFPSHVLVWPVRVQGDTCAPEVTAAIEGFNALAPDGPIPRPDLLIVARGGGSIEDLWGFNEESVVRAVAASHIPIISAVGHETDTTLVDYASDLRAPTPTAAAEAAVPVRAELLLNVDDFGQRLRHAMRRQTQSQRDQLRAAGAGLPRPLDLLAVTRQRLDLSSSKLIAGLRHLGQGKTIDFGRIAPRLSPSLLRRRTDELRVRLHDEARRRDTALAHLAERRRAGLASVMARLSANVLRNDLRLSHNQYVTLAARVHPAYARASERRRAQLDAAGKLLASFSYKNVLARGFALVTDARGELVRRRADVQSGDSLDIELANDETLSAIVGGAAPTRKKSRTPSDRGGQDSLF